MNLTKTNSPYERAYAFISSLDRLTGRRAIMKTMLKNPNLRPITIKDLKGVKSKEEFSNFRLHLRARIRSGKATNIEKGILRGINSRKFHKAASRFGVALAINIALGASTGWILPYITTQQEYDATDATTKLRSSGSLKESILRPLSQNEGTAIRERKKELIDNDGKKNKFLRKAKLHLISNNRLAKKYSYSQL
jgi:hypothetical protein